MTISKKILRMYFLFLITSIIGVNTAVLAENVTLNKPQSEINLTFQCPPSYSIKSDTDSCEYIVIKNYGAITSPGNPELPMQIYDVMLPPDVNGNTLSLQVKTTTEKVPREHMIRPAAPSQKRPEDEPSWGDNKKIVDGKNMYVYGTDSYYPFVSVQLLNQSRMRKWRFVRVAFYPLQYNPVTKKLIKVSNAKVTITFSRTESLDSTILYDNVLNDRAAKRFVNYKKNLNWYTLGQDSIPLSKPLPGPPWNPTDYVIITTNAIVQNSVVLNDFIQHKKNQGHSVMEITESEYDNLNAQSPNTRADKIRKWLQDNYVRRCIKWVLLIGNPDPDDPLEPADMVGNIPMKMCFPEFRGDPESDRIPTDFFYADLSGNWDLDDDGKYGEYCNNAKPTMHDNFSVRWTGKVQIDNAGEWTFRTHTDDGVKLCVNDGDPLIEAWTYGDKKIEKSIYLGTGQYDIKMEYFEKSDGAIARLYWEHNGNEEIIPKSKLLHDDGNGNFISGGLKGEYYAGTDFLELAFSRIDDEINFDWEFRGPDSIKEQVPFSVRWTGKLNIKNTGNYTLHTLSKDRVRLWIDDMITPVIDKWDDHACGWHNTRMLHLDNRMYDIKMEAFNSTGDAVAQLYWTYNNNVRKKIPSDVYHYDAGNGSRGIISTYYEGDNFTNEKFKLYDERIDMYWGGGDQGPDGVDFTPEVYVGRIPVYNNEDNTPDCTTLDQILQKIIDYESNPTIPQWRRSMLFAAVDMFGEEPERISQFEVGEQLKMNFADPLLFRSYRIYEKDFGLIPAPECTNINPLSTVPSAPCNMLKELASNRYGVVGWSTHGGAEGASELMYIDNVQELGDKNPFFIFQGSCSNAWPENKNNLAYSLLKNGAICAVAATRMSTGLANKFENPDPFVGLNCQLIYHYMMRIMNGITSGESLYRTKELINYDYHWVNKMNYNIYGDPTTSLLTPYVLADADIILVLDHSGSMGGYANAANADRKIEALQFAAGQFVDLLDMDVGNQLGIVRFSTSAFPSMRLSPFDAGAKNFAHAAINGLKLASLTSIGDGLSMAVDQFKKHGKESNRRLILLVTDGMETAAPLIAEVENDIISENITVFSLGLGYSNGINTGKLINLSDNTDGDFRVTYDDLIFRKFFMEMLGSAMDWSVVVDPVYNLSKGQTETVSVEISCVDNEVYFSCCWSKHDDAIRLTVVDAGGSTYDIGSSHYQGATRYASYRFELTSMPLENRNGTWKMQVTGLSEPTVRTIVSAMVRTSNKMNVGFNKQVITTRKDCMLRAVLRNNGKPVTGTNVKVAYNIPINWIGNLMHELKVDLSKITLDDSLDTLTPLQKKEQYLR